MKKDLLDISDLSPEEIMKIIDLADEVKTYPERYSTALVGKTLLMIFEKPSLRTRVSFEVGMTQLGGHAIYYDVSTSPMGKKESIADTVKTASRFCDIIMARLFSHDHMQEMALHAHVPVINALTNFSHPCQILADLQTIREKKGKWIGLKVAYFGDGNNNVTHDLIYGCVSMGLDITVACPFGDDFMPQKEVVLKAKEIAKRTGSKLVVTHDAITAAQDADVLYTDSWMSYHIPESEKEHRVRTFMPYQVNEKLMSHAKKDAVFMNCLPAIRGMEQTAGVIDGPQSIVFDEAENRLHAQKALMLKMLKVA